MIDILSDYWTDDQVSKQGDMNLEEMDVGRNDLCSFDRGLINGKG